MVGRRIVFMIINLKKRGEMPESVSRQIKDTGVGSEPVIILRRSGRLPKENIKIDGVVLVEDDAFSFQELFLNLIPAKRL